MDDDGQSAMRCESACLAPLTDAARIKRLRWRCRRGTRELDQLVGWWLDERYPMSSPSQQTAFDALLEEQDPDLWDWVMGRSQPGDAALAEIIDAIRARHRL